MLRRIFGKQAPETAPTLGMEPGLNHDDPRQPTRRKDSYLHLSIHQRILPTNIYHLYSYLTTPHNHFSIQTSLHINLNY